VLTAGTLGSKRHINLPGVHVRLPALTAKDREDVAAGVGAGFDFFALSFVRHGDDVRALRELLQQLGSSARIVAKIEDQSALRNLEDIVQAADAVMVARGDLGIEIPYASLPGVQEQILAVALREGKPVIVATQLLESMISSPMPTRAEITDVWHAVRSQADAVMLSGETTVGRYPRECVEVLRNIIREVEPRAVRELNRTIVLATPKAKMLRAAAVLAGELGGSIIVFTRSGFLAGALSALRPGGVPIYAFTDVPEVFRQMLLFWGVEPFLIPFSDDCEQTILDAFEYLKRREWSRVGDPVAVITNVLAREHIIDTIQVREVK
jgi:pyruvate kinase